MNEQVDLKKVQILAQQRLVEQEKEKQTILRASKGVEAVYQQMIAANQKNAAAIRTELFTLRGSAAIPFEKAYEYATAVSRKTGVRPALILGIIAEESNLGENVGTGNWRVDMKSPRDTVPFQDICARLGLDPDKMPVSKKPWYGYGGAMGPAQFIPSTWILYEDRIADAIGHKPPNPWNPEDALTAAGILLADNGAAGASRAGERLAALRYLAGWANATKKAYAFYGDDVISLADKYQSQINILQAN
jgi:membrane-bound lytic murein transglycosylase B